VLYGEFGALKSWILLDLALHIAAGKDWLGKFPIPNVRRVLYVDEEMGERRVRQRIQQLAAGAEIDPCGRLAIVSHSGLRFDGAGARTLLRNLDACAYDAEVIFVDTFRRVLLGSENDQEDVTAFWRHVDPLVLAQKTVAFSHHMRKRTAHENGPRERASGSTDIQAGADVTLAVTRGEPGHVTISNPKHRDAEEHPPFGVSLQVVGAAASLRLADAPIPSSKASMAEQVVLDYLRHQPNQTATKASILAHAKAAKVAERTIESAVKHLSDARRLIACTRGEWTLAE
jgi:RecA-family ATPase